LERVSTTTKSGQTIQIHLKFKTQIIQIHLKFKTRIQILGLSVIYWYQIEQEEEKLSTNYFLFNSVNFLFVSNILHSIKLFISIIFFNLDQFQLDTGLYIYIKHVFFYQYHNLNYISLIKDPFPCWCLSFLFFFNENIYILSEK